MDQRACRARRLSVGRRAVRQLIDERIAERVIEDDDLAWAKPLVDEAIAEVERGDFLTLDEFEALDAARLAAMRD
jgi:antitoxin ParD1/3/4